MKYKDLIILERSVIEERVKNCQKYIAYHPNFVDLGDMKREMRTLKAILAVSRPAVEIVEKAYDEGDKWGSAEAHGGSNNPYYTKEEFLNSDLI